MIIKRNGSKVDFNKNKIISAIANAMVEVTTAIDPDVCNSIANKIEQLKNDNKVFSVEDIQDEVELELMKVYPEVAKAYILYRNEREKIRNKPWDMTELQKDIYNSKYKLGDESFNEFTHRVSGFNSDISKLIRDKKFIFAGRILAGRGLDRNMTLSNCYVLPQPEDNIESIFDTAKRMARTYSYGGGVGTDLSLLRPTGSAVNNSAETTSGPVSFMELYDVTTSIIGQRGRRGALMLSMSTEHPDINEFINSKNDIENINHANISVRATDEFFKLDSDDKIETLKLISKNNWNTGEPGMLFWDRVEDWHLLSHDDNYDLKATNPCGEQPLPPYGNCLLGSFNLSEYVINPFTDSARIDKLKLSNDIRVAITGLNEVLDENIDKHPLKEQRELARNYRQVGLGIMGLADMFIKLGIKYGSEESLKLSDELGQVFLYTSILQSCMLARATKPYPKFNIETVEKSNFFKALPKYIQEYIRAYGMRNSHVLSIAPTGSISTLFGVSGGIEPIFANYYTRTTKSLSDGKDVDYKVYTNVIDELIESTGETKLPDYCITSHDINPKDRIKVQGVWQKYVDSAISSTINLKEDVTEEDIFELYKLAHSEGLKGVTVFRNNCNRMGILNCEDT